MAVSAQTPPSDHPANPATNVVVLTPDYLSQLAEEMRTNHPALRAAQARTNAAAANLRSVRTWKDPMARVGGMAADEAMRADEGDIIYGVEQMLPLFGKPQLARRVAGAELDVETADADFLFQMLRTQLAKAAFRLSLADQVASVGAQDFAWLQTMAQAVEIKYRANQASLTEWLQVENERDKRRVQLQTDRDKVAHEGVTLNRLLNRQTPLPWPKLDLPPLAGPVVYNERLVNFALQYEPKTRLMRQQIKQAEAMVNLTRRERQPDISAGIEARNYSGDGSFRQGMFVLSMNLPWFNSSKYLNDRQREEARQQALEFDLQDYQAGLREELHQLTIKIDAARREALLYRDEIIPRSQSALERARVGWESGQSGFRDLLEARRMLLEARLMFARAANEQYEMLAELVLCCGLGDLGALEMLGAMPDTLTEGTKP